jgi:hypothetical protein
VSTEAHLTLSHPICADSALQAWLAPRGLTFTRIELSHGISPQQAMITLWAATRDDALRDVRTIRSDLAALGVGVSRIKLEVAHVPGAPTVPALYLEHHVKVRTTPERIAELGLLGVAHGAYLSRNPRRRVDGVEERFLTQRFTPRDGDTAEAGLQALLAALRAAAVPIAKLTRERVIHDDNLALDAGWRTEPSP